MEPESAALQQQQRVSSAAEDKSSEDVVCSRNKCGVVKTTRQDGVSVAVAEVTAAADAPSSMEQDVRIPAADLLLQADGSPPSSPSPPYPAQPVSRLRTQQSQRGTPKVFRRPFGPVTKLGLGAVSSKRRAGRPRRVLHWQQKQQQAQQEEGNQRRSDVSCERDVETGVVIASWSNPLCDSVDF